MREAAGVVFAGTAGWSIPLAVARRFGGDGAHLERYSRVFPAVKINSSFHRPHRLGTYERWAAVTPTAFRFAVKLPKAITHGRRLVDADDLIAAFADESAGLGDKRAVILVQLPPSLAFDAAVAEAFFAALARRIPASIACEPRHASWFTPAADAWLAARHVARVAADPVLAPGGERSGGWRGLRYHRLHGVPRVYYSAYDEPALQRLAQELLHDGEPPAPTWCMFDNTASGAATTNALALQELVGARAA